MVMSLWDVAIYLLNVLVSEGCTEISFTWLAVSDDHIWATVQNIGSCVFSFLCLTVIDLLVLAGRIHVCIQSFCFFLIAHHYHVFSMFLSCILSWNCLLSLSLLEWCVFSFSLFLPCGCSLLVSLLTFYSWSFTVLITRLWLQLVFPFCSVLFTLSLLPFSSFQCSYQSPSFHQSYCPSMLCMCWYNLL